MGDQKKVRIILKEKQKERRLN